MAYITKKSKKPEMLGDVGFKLDKKPEYIKKKEKKKEWITKKKEKKVEYIKKKEKKYITKKKELSNLQKKESSTMGRYNVNSKKRWHWF